VAKTLIALRHMCVKEFGVEFKHEKTFRDLGSGFVVNFKYCWSKIKYF